MWGRKIWQCRKLQNYPCSLLSGTLLFFQHQIMAGPSASVHIHMCIQGLSHGSFVLWQLPNFTTTGCWNIWSLLYPVHHSLPGPGCSKLTTLLVNISLKFQMLISQNCQYFLMKKASVIFSTRGPIGPESLTWVYRPKVKHLTLKSEWTLTKVKKWPWPLILTQLYYLI